MNTLQDTRLSDFVVRIITPVIIAAAALTFSWRLFVTGFSVSAADVLNIIVLRAAPIIFVAMAALLRTLGFSYLKAKKSGAGTSNYVKRISYVSITLLVALTLFTVSSFFVLL